MISTKTNASLLVLLISALTAASSHAHTEWIPMDKRDEGVSCPKGEFISGLCLSPKKNNQCIVNGKNYYGAIQCSGADQAYLVETASILYVEADGAGEHGEWATCPDQYLPVSILQGKDVTHLACAPINPSAIDVDYSDVEAQCIDNPAKLLSCPRGFAMLSACHSNNGECSTEACADQKTSNGLECVRVVQAGKQPEVAGSADESESASDAVGNDQRGGLRGRRTGEDVDTNDSDDGEELSLSASSCSTNTCSGFNTSPRHGCCQGYYCDYGLLVVAGTCKKSRQASEVVDSIDQDEVAQSLSGVTTEITAEDVGDDSDQGEELSLSASSCSTNTCSGFSTAPRRGCCQGYYCDYGLLVVAGTCKRRL